MPHPQNIGIYQSTLMKQSLSTILFLSEQQQEDTAVLADIGKTITDTLEPLTKQVKQIGNDVKVIQQAQGQKKQEPTNARSTSGATKPATTSIPKGPGIITPAGSGKDGSEELSARIDNLTGKVDKIVSLIEQKEFGKEAHQTSLSRVLFFEQEQPEEGGVAWAEWFDAMMEALKRTSHWTVGGRRRISNGTMDAIINDGKTFAGCKEDKECVAVFTKEATPYLMQAVGSDAASVSFMGAGAIGLAFLVKDSDEHEYVFKMETDFGHGAATKHKKIPGAQQQRSGDPAGASQPMVYDHGTFKVFKGALRVDWFLTERLETGSGETKMENILPAEMFGRLNGLVDILRVHSNGFEPSPSKLKYYKVNPGLLNKDLVKAISMPIKKMIDSDVEAALRLAGDWHVKLAQDIIHMAKNKIPTDFHEGNIGIQRNGPEGYLKFFD